MPLEHIYAAVHPGDRDRVGDEFNRRGIPFVAVSHHTSDQWPRVFENSAYRVQPFHALRPIDSVRRAAGSASR